MDKIIVDTLTESEYADAFAAFVNRSHEYELMLKFVVSEINSIDSASVLSIGAGTEHFDNEIISQLENKPKWVAIEPNVKHLEQLTKYNNMVVIPQYFTSDFHIDDKFDYILLSHSLYCMPEPYEMIKYASTFLKENGKMIIIHQSDVGVYQFMKDMMNEYITYRTGPYAHHEISSVEIISELEKSGFKCETTRLMSYLNMINVFENKEILDGILSFFIQTNVTKLPNELYNHIVDKLRNSVVNNTFAHPNDAIVVTYK